MKQGYVHIYTGEGKGKTSAALGLCLRARGADLEVYIAQFLKKSNSSELKALKKYLKKVSIHQFGTGKFVKGKPSKADTLSAARGFLELTDAVLSGKYDLVIADELCVAVDLELISPRNVIHLIQNKPKNVEFVMTGRNAHPQLIRNADLVSEIRKKKHYYDKGVKARKGIES